MKLVDWVHGHYVHERRVVILGQQIATLLPDGARVLDVGSGDGRLAVELSRRRPDIRVEGVDVLVRDDARIPTEVFDGRSLPHANAAFDVILLADVVHHADDPVQLLSECVRVAKCAVIVKDHLLDGFAAEFTLRLMDGVGNRRHGVAIPYHYWSRAQWRRVLDGLPVRVSVWNEQLRLYPPPLDTIFGRSLHFLARADVAQSNHKRPARPLDNLVDEEDASAARVGDYGALTE